MEKHPDEKPVFISGKDVRKALLEGRPVDPRIMRRGPRDPQPWQWLASKKRTRERIIRRTQWRKLNKISLVLICGQLGFVLCLRGDFLSFGCVSAIFSAASVCRRPDCPACRFPASY